MNIYEAYYSVIAKKCNTDMNTAKEIFCAYLRNLKEEIDKSDDEEAKTRWYESFGDSPDPDPDWFILTVFLFGGNSYKPKK